jgi:hypothetical protein
MVERSSEVAGLNGNFWAKGHMENPSMTHAYGVKGKEKEVADEAALQNKKISLVKPRGYGGTRRGREWEHGVRESNKAGSKEMVGKRKEIGSQGDGGQREGKRY